jgi:hypothetical protein
MLVVVAGCQAVQGVDFNKMLKQSIQVSSFEGKETVEFKLLLADDALEDMPAEEAELMQLFSQIKLQLDSIKLSDSAHMSLAGKLELGDKSIGFSMKMNEELVEIAIEGAKKPIVLHLNEGMFAEDQPSAEEAPGQASAAEAGKQIVDIVSGYAINNLPNPTNLSVAAGAETVNGETVNGMHIKTELNGKEIWKWIGTYVDALINDKEGLKAMLSALLDALESQSGALQSAAGESIFGSLPEADEKADAVQKAADNVIEMLTQFKDEMKQAEKDDPESINQVFNEQTYIKADMFIDNKLDIRKSTIEAAVKPESDENGEDFAGMPIEGIWIKISGESWNVNGTVTPDAPVQSDNSLDAQELLMMEGYQIVRQFNSDSVIYGLLRNQLHITKQTVMLHPEYGSSRPIKTPAGITLIPLRDTASQLGATLTKDRAAGTINVYDEATNTKIKLKVGSNQVSINGKKVKWAFPTTQVKGVTYVPARDFTKALGGTVSWEDQYGDQMLVIVREP